MDGECGCGGVARRGQGQKLKKYSDDQKLERALSKKLRAIDELLEKQAGGTVLDEQQLEKVNTRKTLAKELRVLKCVMSQARRQVSNHESRLCRGVPTRLLLCSPRDTRPRPTNVEPGSPWRGAAVAWQCVSVLGRGGRTEACAPRGST